MQGSYCSYCTQNCSRGRIPRVCTFPSESTIPLCSERSATLSISERLMVKMGSKARRALENKNPHLQNRMKGVFLKQAYLLQ